MRKIDEIISRLGEIEFQLRGMQEPTSLDPDWPEEMLGLIADDIRKARETMKEFKEGDRG